MKNQGFTLIELLVYVAILTAFLIIVTVFIWDAIFNDIKENAYQEVQQNARFSLTKIGQEIRKATRILHPLPGSSDHYLSLEMLNPERNPTVFEVSEGKLRIVQGTMDPLEITTDKVLVNSLAFTNLSYQNTPGTVRTEITISHINPANQPEYGTPLALKSTVSLLQAGAGIPEKHCTGQTSPCDKFTRETDCLSQSGCLWTPGSCNGICTPCDQLSETDCFLQEGCNWSRGARKCIGKCTDCNRYESQSSCELQLGCSWTTPYCSGTTTPCEDYTNETDCLNQQGCQWTSS